jgi:hypothetical protein
MAGRVCASPSQGAQSQSRPSRLVEPRPQPGAKREKNSAARPETWVSFAASDRRSGVSSVTSVIMAAQPLRPDACINSGGSRSANCSRPRARRETLLGISMVPPDQSVELEAPRFCRPAVGDIEKCGVSQHDAGGVFVAPPRTYSLARVVVGKKSMRRYSAPG